MEKVHYSLAVGPGFSIFQSYLLERDGSVVTANGAHVLPPDAARAEMYTAKVKEEEEYGKKRAKTDEHTRAIEYKTERYFVPDRLVRDAYTGRLRLNYGGVKERTFRSCSICCGHCHVVPNLTASYNDVTRWVSQS